MSKHKIFFLKIENIAKHKYAIITLIIISFIESFFSPIPPDIILTVMVLLNPSKTPLYVFVTTLSSVLGGIIGYIIGYFFFLKLFMINLINSGYFISYQEIVNMFTNHGLLTILLAGFISPLPYKLCTISAGLVKFNFMLFLICSIISRGSRFLLIAFILKKYNNEIKYVISICIKFIKHIIIIVLILICFKYYFL